jgi:hypothetical protein
MTNNMSELQSPESMNQDTNTHKKVLITLVVLLLIAVAGLITLKYMGIDKTEQTSQEAVEIDESESAAQNDNATTPEESDNAGDRDPSGLAYSSEDFVYNGDAPVYVTIYSHNEDSWEAKVNTPEKYYNYREALIERAEALAEYDLEWNWQTDQPVVDAMVEHEYNELFNSKYNLSGDADKNVLEYLATLGVHFDPHAHKNNYADIAFIMEEFLGVDATPVIGGLTHVECGKELYGFLDYMSWHEQIDLQPDGYVHGSDFEEARWKPEILSDPGMGGHYFDDYSVGVWKPGNEDDFYNHYPESDITYIGEGYPHDSVVIGSHHASGATVWSQDGAYLKELVEKIQNKELPTGLKTGEAFMYTASVHMRDTDVVTEGGLEVNTIDGISALMDELQPLRDEEKLLFVDFEEAARIWKNEFNELPYFTSLESFSFYGDLKKEAGDFCEERLAQEKNRPAR